MSRNDFGTLIVALWLLVLYFIASGLFVGMGLQLIGVEVLVKNFLVAWVYFNIAALMTIGLYAGLWKVLND